MKNTFSLEKYNGVLKIINSFIYWTANIIFIAVILSLIFLLKSKTQLDFHEHIFLAGFAFFVTLFQFARLIAALIFYIQKYLKNKFTHCTYKEPIYEPCVSFVIPCKNEEGCIRNNIEKCFEVNYPKKKIEVIVINDGSTDGTILILKSLKKEYGERLIIVDWKVNKGKRHGMAEGFRLSRGEIIVQLDSDSFIEPKDFRKVIRPFENAKIGAVCAHADPTNANLNFVTRMQAAYYFMSFRVLKAAESTFMSVFCCSGCSSAYRKCIVLPILDDWLNENFLGAPVTWGDDRSLTSWVLKLGYGTIYIDDVQAYTIVPSTWKQLYKQQLRWKKSWIINSIFTSKFLWRRNPFMALFYFFPLVIIGFLTPFIAIYSLVYLPIVFHQLPYVYIISCLLITALFVVFYKMFGRDNKHWPYLFFWSLFNILFLSYVMFIAVIKIQDRGWGTR